MKTLFYIILILVLGQCQSKSSVEMKSKDQWEVNKFDIKKGSELNDKDWRCTEAGEENICIPSSWEPLEQEVVYYFAYLNNNNDNTYFTIAKIDTFRQKVNDIVYLRELYSQSLKDSTEKFEGYTLKKLIFADKEAYYGEYYTIINGIPYFMYSMLIEHRGFLYDIALKVERNKDPDYKETFQNILFNFKVNGILLFSEKDELQKIQVIDLSTI